MNDLKIIESRPFGEIQCDFYSDGKDIFITREQIGIALEYANPQKAIGNLHNAHKDRIDSIDRAIEKLPEYKGTVRRSITDFGIEDIEAFWSQHTPGARITFPAYTSSGTEVYDESFPIQYVIQSKTGRDMREYNPGEFEVLFKRGTEFNVSKVDGNTIFMEEV